MIELKYKKLNNKLYWYIKRLLDIFFSLILIIITLPLLIITIIITLFNLGLPLCNERKQREGLYHKEFTMYKIRTKKLHSDNLKREERYTRVSFIIDMFHLNEIPQLFNILKGDMSFIGPRPFIPNEKLPDGKISEKRYLVRPGITGLSQIKGGRFISHEGKLRLDEEYYDNFGFIQDLKILVLTPVDVIKQNNGYYIRKYK